MRTIARSLAGTIAGIGMLGSPLVVAAADRCTRNTWPVDGAPLTATICLTAPTTVAESFERNGATITRSLTFEAVGGADAARAIDTVALDEIGSPKRLHVTVVVRGGVASVEHALLLPGALVLK
jgi:hypothetical protein